MFYDFVDFTCKVIDYDSYNNLFDIIMKPEYKGQAENFLVEAIEKDDCFFEASYFYVCVDADKTMGSCDLRFCFMNSALEEDIMKEDMPCVELLFKGMV